jgi:hypothetical protein
MTLTVVFALAAAFSNAVNLMTQHSASAGAPKRERGWRLVGYLFRQPLWLAGWVAAAGAFAFQALALHDGQLSVVQPVLVTELVFVLVLRRVWIRQDVARAAWAAVLAVCAALAVFLTVAEPAGGHPAPETAQWLSAVFASGGAIAVLAAAGMRGSPVRRAAVFAMAAALAWALMATFLKTATQTLATSGIGGILTRWPVYALAAAATRPGALRAVLQVVHYRRPDIGRQRQRVVPIPFAPHGDLTAAPADAIQPQRRYLPGPQPEPGQQRQDRKIPPPCDGAQIAAGQQRRHLTGRQPGG